MNYVLNKCQHFCVQVAVYIPIYNHYHHTLLTWLMLWSMLKDRVTNVLSWGTSYKKSYICTVKKCHVCNLSSQWWSSLMIWNQNGAKCQHRPLIVEQLVMLIMLVHSCTLILSHNRQPHYHTFRRVENACLKGTQCTLRAYNFCHTSQHNASFFLHTIVLITVFTLQFPFIHSHTQRVNRFCYRAIITHWHNFQYTCKISFNQSIVCKTKYHRHSSRV